MKTQVFICLIILTVSVGLSTAEANYDINEVQEFSGTKMEGGRSNHYGQKTGRQDGKKEAAKVLSLSELIFSKDAAQGFTNNILLWILFILTDYFFQFV